MLGKQQAYPLPMPTHRFGQFYPAALRDDAAPHKPLLGEQGEDDMLDGIEAKDLEETANAIAATRVDLSKLFRQDPGVAADYAGL